MASRFCLISLLRSVAVIDVEFSYELSLWLLNTPVIVAVPVDAIRRLLAAPFVVPGEAPRTSVPAFSLEYFTSRLLQ